jgi:cell wall-associated NlpC family hydrolase
MRPEGVPPTGQIITAAALSQLGKPYRFGGLGPDAFDCSGLVRFAFAAAGIAVPRTTGEQFRAADPVNAADLRVGDLLFFRIGGSGVSHVGIYLGERRFIHAPQTGRPVETRSLDDDYYRARLLRMGRLY